MLQTSAAHHLAPSLPGAAVARLLNSFLASSAMLVESRKLPLAQSSRNGEWSTKGACSAASRGRAAIWAWGVAQEEGSWGWGAWPARDGDDIAMAAEAEVTAAGDAAAAVVAGDAPAAAKTTGEASARGMGAVAATCGEVVRIWRSALPAPALTPGVAPPADVARAVAGVGAGFFRLLTAGLRAAACESGRGSRGYARWHCKT